MKSYTDLEQSKKLAKILNEETADLWWDTSELKPRFEKHYHEYLSVTIDPIPCWSLAALLSILPKLVRLVGTPKESFWYCECVDSKDQWYGGFESADNPVDACVGMIIKLNKQNLL